MDVYRFDHPHQAEFEDLTRTLGGKGSGLWAMTTQLGLPTPPGLTIPTSYQAEFDRAGVTDDLMEKVLSNLSDIGQGLGRQFGDAQRPLLISVRSGAAVSMPGMMDTILNVGLTPSAVEGLANMTGEPHFALDSYRRFLSQFAETALGLDHGLPVSLATPDAAKAQIAQLKTQIANAHGDGFLDDPVAILRTCIEAVYRSWQSPRAMHYREKHDLPHDAGTAVNIQAMVFGNLDDASGTGVVFSRDPSSGLGPAKGDYLPCAQGEEVVAGSVTTLPYDALRHQNPEAHAALAQAMSVLEQYYEDMVDVEFTIESGKLWILQARRGKRTPAAAARIAIDLAMDPTFQVTRADALARLPDGYFDGCSDLKHASKGRAIASGLGASPGLATGIVVLTAEDAVERCDTDDVVLVRPETSPADIHGMSVAKGILTTLGGQMSHAAVVARDWSLPAVVGASDLVLGDDGFSVGGVTVKEGDVISIDGATGEIFCGAVESRNEIDPARATLEDWARELGLPA